MEATLAGATVLALSVVGFLDALLFVLATYRLASLDADWLPRFCRMDGATCARIVDTRYGRLFGLPNSVPGLLWYVATGAWGGWTLATGQPPLCEVFVVAAAGVVIVSVFLAWSLVFRLRTHCPLCYLSHGINGALLLVIAAACGGWG